MDRKRCEWRAVCVCQPRLWLISKLAGLEISKQDTARLIAPFCTQRINVCLVERSDRPRINKLIPIMTSVLLFTQGPSAHLCALIRLQFRALEDRFFAGLLKPNPNTTSNFY